jgi:hypothetical protein
VDELARRTFAFLFLACFLAALGFCLWWLLREFLREVVRFFALIWRRRRFSLLTLLEVTAVGAVSLAIARVTLANKTGAMGIEEVIVAVVIGTPVAICFVLAAHTMAEDLFAAKQRNTGREPSDFSKEPRRPPIVFPSSFAVPDTTEESSEGLAGPGSDPSCVAEKPDSVDDDKQQADPLTDGPG